MTYARPALDLIGDLRRGKVAHELTEELHALIAACQETGKKGELLLKISIEPDKDAPDERMRITDLIATKAPRRAVKPSLFFLDTDGNLTRSDPNQLTLDGVRDAASPTPIDRKQQA